LSFSEIEEAKQFELALRVRVKDMVDDKIEVI
jgi:hypothetical protein